MTSVSKPTTLHNLSTWF